MKKNIAEFPIFSHKLYTSLKIAIDQNYRSRLQFQFFIISKLLRGYFCMAKKQPSPKASSPSTSSIPIGFAELQALSRISMSMKDWIAKLDDFLRMASRDILLHAGKISHEEALDKARIEYSKYQQQALVTPSLVEQHFLETIKEIEKAALTK